MKNKILLPILFVTFAASLGLRARAAELVFESDTKAKKSNQSQFQTIHAGEAIPFDSSDPLLVITQKGLPILFYCPNSKSAKATILDADVSTALQEELRPTLQMQTNEIITQLRRAESLIQKKDYNQALSVITVLKEKYKEISPILFMSGTIYYLLNNKPLAIEELQKGLALDPQDDSAKRLLTQLKGAS